MIEVQTSFHKAVHSNLGIYSYSMVSVGSVNPLVAVRFNGEQPHRLLIGAYLRGTRD